MAEPTERDLIPLGLPHGQRQETERAMRQAELPFGSESAAPTRPDSPQPTNRGPSRVPDMLRARQPRTAPDLTQILNPQSPQPQPLNRQQRLTQMRDQTTNPLLREILNRMMGGV